MIRQPKYLPISSANDSTPFYVKARQFSAWAPSSCRKFWARRLKLVDVCRVEMMQGISLVAASLRAGWDWAKRAPRRRRKGVRG